MKAIKIVVTPKKGVEQVTHWGITQRRPYPSIGGVSVLRWDCHDGLMSTMAGEHKELKEEYTCTLLRSDKTEWEDFNYHNEAGTEGNPGEIVYRGKGLGKLYLLAGRVQIGTQMGWWWNFYFSARHSSGEQQFLEKQVTPQLQKALEEHRQELREEAIEGLGKYMAQKLKHADEQLDRMTSEMEALIERLNKKGTAQ